MTVAEQKKFDKLKAENIQLKLKLKEAGETVATNKILERQIAESEGRHERKNETISTLRVDKEAIKAERDSLKEKLEDAVRDVKGVTKWPLKKMIFAGVLLVGITILVTSLFNNKGAKKFNTAKIEQLKRENESLQINRDSLHEKTFADSIRLSALEGEAERQKQITDILISGNETERKKIYKQLNEKINNTNSSYPDRLRNDILTEY